MLSEEKLNRLEDQITEEKKTGCDLLQGYYYSPRFRQTNSRKRSWVVQLVKRLY